MKQLLSVAFMILTTLAHAQDKRSITDAFGIRGTISTSSGTLPDSILPEKGKYSFTWRDIEAPEIRTWQASGSMRNHAMHGEWVWEEGRWHFNIDARPDREPALATRGVRSRRKGQFAAGIASGNWQLTIDSVAGSTAGKGSGLTIQAVFQDGHMVGSFTVNDLRGGQRVSIRGACDAKGMATGRWVYTFQPPMPDGRTAEMRTYRNGVLTSVGVSYGDSSSEKSLDHVVQWLDAMEKPGADALPVRVGALDFDMDGTPGAADVYNAYYLELLFFGGWRHPHFPADIQRKGPVFKRLEYPLTSRESFLIQQSDSLARELQADMSIRLGYRNILLNRGKTPELDLSLAYIQACQERLQTIDSLLLRTRSPLFTYKNRLSGLDHWKSALALPGSAVGVYFPSEERTLPLAIAELDALELIWVQLMELTQRLPDHYAEVDAANQYLQLQGEVNALGDTLSDALGDLDAQYSELGGTGAWVYERWVQAYISDQIALFAQAEGYEQAMDAGRRVRAEMDSLLQWAPLWPAYDSIPEMLSKRYSQFLYNPYTGKHDIEVRLKRRFYNDVSTQLWPAMERKLAETDTWEAFEAQWLTNRLLFSDLMAIAALDNRHTSRLEKRVLRESDPAGKAKLIRQFMRD